MNTIPLQHGGLVFDVPAGWSDQSTVLVVAPPLPPALTSSPTAGIAETVSVRFVRVAEGQSAGDVANAELDQLEQLQTGLRREPAVSFACGFGEGARVDASLDLQGLEVRQVVVAVVVGGQAIVASGVCAAARAAIMQPTLISILASLRPAGEAPQTTRTA